MRYTLLCLLVSTFAFAESPEPAAAPPPVWSGSGELSSLITSGNSRNTTLGVGAVLNYQPLPWSWKASVNYLTSSNTGALSAESFDTLLRGEHPMSPSLSAFSQLTYLKNVFTGFNDRFTGDVGAVVKIIQNAEHRLGSELALGVDAENRVDGLNQTFLMARAAVEYGWKFSPTSELGVSLSVMESLRDTRDLRISNSYSVTAVLTSLLSLKASFKLDFLNLPVTGKLPLDTTTTASLVAKF